MVSLRNCFSSCQRGSSQASVKNPDNQASNQEPAVKRLEALIKTIRDNRLGHFNMERVLIKVNPNSECATNLQTKITEKTKKYFNSLLFEASEEATQRGNMRQCYYFFITIANKICSCVSSGKKTKSNNTQPKYIFKNHKNVYPNSGNTNKTKVLEESVVVSQIQEILGKSLKEENSNAFKAYWKALVALSIRCKDFSTSHALIALIRTIDRFEGLENKEALIAKLQIFLENKNAFVKISDEIKVEEEGKQEELTAEVSDDATNGLYHDKILKKEFLEKIYQLLTVDYANENLLKIVKNTFMQKDALNILKKSEIFIKLTLNDNQVQTIIKNFPLFIDKQKHKYTTIHDVFYDAIISFKMAESSKEKLSIATCNNLRRALSEIQVSPETSRKKSLESFKPNSKNTKRHFYYLNHREKLATEIYNQEALQRDLSNKVLEYIEKNNGSDEAKEVFLTLNGILNAYLQDPKVDGALLSAFNVLNGDYQKDTLNGFPLCKKDDGDFYTIREVLDAMSDPNGGAIIENLKNYLKAVG